MTLESEVTLNVLFEALEKLRGLLDRADLPRGESFNELDDALQIAWICARRFALEASASTASETIP
jgi:hypothetical protein